MNKIQIIETKDLIQNENNSSSLMKNERIVKLDIVRTFAILCVILCHSCEAVYGLVNNNMDYTIISVLHTISRLGVPMFLFLSGTLLLNKNISTDEDVKGFYKKNLLPLILANTIWVILYNIFLWYVGPKRYVNIKMIIKELFFLKQVPVPNMWYFPMIIGVYFGIPFIAKIVKTFSLNSIKAILAFLLVSNFIIPSINIFLDILRINDNFEILLDLNFFGGLYGVYIIIGYYIYNNTLYNNAGWYIALTIGNFLIALFQRVLVGDIWYNSIFLLICGGSIFGLFNKINDTKINYKMGKMCTYISKISLALFFVHYIVQTLLFKYIWKIEMAPSLKCIILYIGVTIFSIIVVKIISKIKIVSKYVLLIK